MATQITVSVEEIKVLESDIYLALGDFGADTVSTDYRVDIIGYNNLNQAHSLAREKRSGAMGFASSIAGNLATIVETIKAADAEMIQF